MAQVLKGVDCKAENKVVKAIVFPENDPNATHITTAIGTGVASFRGYLRRMFLGFIQHSSLVVLLFLGVANTDSFHQCLDTLVPVQLYLHRLIPLHHLLGYHIQPKMTWVM